MRSWLSVQRSMSIGPVKVGVAEGRGYTAELAGVRAEAEVGHLRQRHVGHIEALHPLVLLLVLQVELQVVLLEICELRLGGDAGASDAAGGAPSELGGLSVVRVVVARLSVTEHSRNIRENDAGAVVLVGIDEDSKTLEVVGATEDGAGDCALLRDPERHAVAEEVAAAMEFEFPLDLEPCVNLLAITAVVVVVVAGPAELPPSSSPSMVDATIAILLGLAGPT
jgi:hypothetical protein